MKLIKSFVPHSRCFGSYFDVIFLMYLVSSGFSFKPTSSCSSSSSSTQFSQEWARRKVVVKHSIKSKSNVLWMNVYVNVSGVLGVLYKLCTKSSEYCLCGAIARGLLIVPFIGVSIPFDMPLIMCQYHDHNERCYPEKRGGVPQKFANIPQCQYWATAHRPGWSSMNSIVTHSESNCTVLHSCSRDWAKLLRYWSVKMEGEVI